MSLTERKTKNNQVFSTQKTTIFDLLKRKKQNTRYQTITKLYHSSNRKSSQYDEMDQDKNQYQTKNNLNYNSTSVKQHHSITPAKILFQPNRVSQISENKQEEPIVRENLRKGKSFLSMISPIKIRASQLLQQKPQNQKLMEPVKKIQKPYDYSRKNVTKAINSLKDKVTSVQANFKKLKYKSRELALLLNPILNSVSTDNYSVSKQVGQIKNALKSLDILVGQISQNDSAQAIQNLNHSLQQNLKMLQSQIRRSLLEDKSNQLQKFNRQKENQIEKLQLDLKKVIKDNELLIRKIEKISSAKQQIIVNSTKQSNTHLQQTERVKVKLLERIDELNRYNQDLENKLKTGLSEIKVLQQQFKNERMLKEDFKSKFAQNIQEVTEAKNKQLIQQIMRLKAQFNADMNRINQLHEFKQFQLINKLKQKDEQLAKLNYEKQSNKQIQIKMIEEANTLKQDNTNLKIQIDGLVADMHRMNQELYQHWIALKDIKALTTRLGTFSHFRLIYQDIAFNDHLFL